MKKWHVLNVKIDGATFSVKASGSEIETVTAWLEKNGAEFAEVSSVSPMRPHTKQTSKIAQARVAKGWTQTDLADAIGVAHQHIQRWEAGKYKVKKETLMRIGDALGVDWTTLVED